MENALRTIQDLHSDKVIVLEALGVEQIDLHESGAYALRLLREDDSVVELETNAVAAFTEGRSARLSSELEEQSLNVGDESVDYFTEEPGFSAQAGSIRRGVRGWSEQSLRRYSRSFCVVIRSRGSGSV